MMTEELIMEMKKLVNKGEDTGNVLPVSEVFKLYPVNEEVHKGELEYWKLNMKREIGDIVDNKYQYNEPISPSAQSGLKP